MGNKSAAAHGARRALWEFERLRETYTLAEITVSDGEREYTEEELRQLAGQAPDTGAG